MSVIRFLVFVCFLCIGFSTTPQLYAQKSRRANIDSVKQELKAIEFERLLIQANLSKNKKEFEQALEWYYHALSLNPKSAVVYYELACIYKERKKYHDALKSAQKAVEYNPNMIAYRSFLAELYDERGDVNKQIQQLEYIQKLQPKNIQLYYSIADVYYVKMMYDKCLQTLSTIEKEFGINEEIRYKRFVVYTRQNNLKQAQLSIDELIRLYPSRLEYGLAAIELYEKNGQYLHAIELCNQYVSIGNDPAEVLYAKARMCSHLDIVGCIQTTLIELFKFSSITQNQKQEIITILLLQNTKSPTIYTKRYEILESMHDSLPNDEVLLGILGQYYIQNNNLERALPFLYRALNQEQTNANVYNQIIEIETKGMRWDSVVSVASAAIVVFPNNADLYSALGQAYIKTKQYNKAITTLQDGIELVYIRKQKRIFYVLLAEALYAIKSYEAAFQSLDKALDIDAANEYTISLYALYAALQQNMTQAQHMLQLCATCNQIQAYTLAQASIFLQQSQYKQALGLIQTIQNPTLDAIYYELLGDILWVNNQLEEAQIAWEKANQQGASIDIQRKKLFLQKK